MLRQCDFNTQNRVTDNIRFFFSKIHMQCGANSANINLLGAWSTTYPWSATSNLQVASNLHYEAIFHGGQDQDANIEESNFSSTLLGLMLSKE